MMQPPMVPTWGCEWAGVRVRVRGGVEVRGGVK